MNDKGIIIKATGGFYYVETAEKVYECKARGIFRKKANSPLVGDKVLITISENGYSTVDEIFERKNTIIRPPLANLDTLFIVSSMMSPSYNTLIIDKMVAVCEYKNIEPVVIFTKTDLKDSADVADIYRKAGIKTFEYSSLDNNGLDAIAAELKGKISAFTGNSGVGKSTLLNALFPSLMLETGDISSKLGRGRHTTRTVELFKTEGGYVADTPGFSTLDIERYEIIKKDQLQYCFKEFDEYLGSCKFNSCAHVCENGCAVLEALKNGEISKSRHQSYVSMYNEVKDLKDWEMK